MLLGRTKKNELTIQRMNKSSFGANLFDLYNDGFYLDEFIGQFAKMKIENAIERLLSDNADLGEEKDLSEENDIAELAELIGEPILRGSIKKLLGKKRGK